MSSKSKKAYKKRKITNSKNKLNQIIDQKARILILIKIMKIIKI